MVVVAGVPFGQSGATNALRIASTAKRRPGPEAGKARRPAAQDSGLVTGR